MADRTGTTGRKRNVKEGEWRINAKGLSPPGPRLMVKNALPELGGRALRVVVSDTDSVKDLQAYFKKLGRTCVVDEIGDEFHMLVDAVKDE